MVKNLQADIDSLKANLTNVENSFHNVVKYLDGALSVPVSDTFSHELRNLKLFKQTLQSQTPQPSPPITNGDLVPVRYVTPMKICSNTSDPKDLPDSGAALRVIQAYQPCFFDELELNTGETINFLDFVQDGWWKGQNSKNKIGLFPSNFVTVE